MDDLTERNGEGVQPPVRETERLPTVPEAQIAVIEALTRELPDGPLRVWGENCATQLRRMLTPDGRLVLRDV